jgi:hypothetical protein
MRLGSETASVVNNLMSRGVIGEPVPVVGMGVTMLGWTDRYPGTIVKVSELCGKRWKYEIEVTRDDDKVISGSMMDGSASYEFTPNLVGKRTMFRKSLKTGMWVEGYINSETLKFNKSGGKGLRIGERERYLDPSF